MRRPNTRHESMTATVLAEGKRKKAEAEEPEKKQLELRSRWLRRLQVFFVASFVFGISASIYRPPPERLSLSVPAAIISSSNSGRARRGEAVEIKEEEDSEEEVEVEEEEEEEQQQQQERQQQQDKEEEQQEEEEDKEEKQQQQQQQQQAEEEENHENEIVSSASSSSSSPSSLLRFDWSNLPPQTPLGRRMQAVQSKCLTQPEEKQQVVTFKLLSSGMGSSLHTWSQALCHATLNDKVLLTMTSLWEWNDRELCDGSLSEAIGTDERFANTDESTAVLQRSFMSPLWCYFGFHESGLVCPADTLDLSNIPKPSDDWGSYKCVEFYEEYGVPTIRSAAMEWLFQSVARPVIDEAERQVREDAFVNYTATSERLIPPSESLITIHIRWGDKQKEMELASIGEYINATYSLLTPAETEEQDPVYIYICTEDPTAVSVFAQQAPSHWQVFSSGPRHDGTMLSMSRTTEGRAGLESLAALLVAMEANRYVLTTSSNWSRLLNELRKGIVDPRCNDCTEIVDLRWIQEE